MPDEHRHEQLGAGPGPADAYTAASRHVNTVEYDSE